jgi:hypothetical protein
LITIPLVALAGLVSAQTVSTTSLANNNGSSVAVYSVLNTTAVPVILSEIGSVSGVTNTYTAHLYARTVTYDAPTTAPGAITSANGWTVVGSNTSLSLTGNTLTSVAQTFITGMNYMIPPLTQVQFALQTSTGANQPTFSTVAGNLRYSTMGTQPSVFNVGGIEIRVGAGYGFGGTMAAANFTPRGFIGFMTFLPATPCTGTPAPGNTVASVSGACVGQNFNLSLQNMTSGTGVTYAWEFDNGGGWTAFGTNAPTQSVNQSVATSYRCTVTCTELGGGSATSNPISVPMSTPFPVDFAPTTFAPNCWTSTVSAFLARNPAVNAFGAPGSGAAQWNFYNASAGTVLSLTSPSFTAVGAGQQLRFDIAGTAYTADGVAIDSDILNVEASTDGGATWTTLAAMSNNTGGDANTAPPQAANFVPTAAQWTSRAYAIPTGTNTVRFRGVSGFGNSVYVDNINIEPIPTCFPPTSVAALGTSSTAANVTWSGTGTFIVEYGPAATFTTPGTGAGQGPEGTSTVVTGITGNAFLITGLTHPTEYRVFVRKDCTGTNEGYSVNSPGISFFSQPPNDLCINAPNVSVGAGATVSITGNSFGATDTEGFGAPNAWESITVTECMESLEINYCATTQPWTLAFLNLFTDCGLTGFIAPTTALNNCPNGNRRHVYGNIPPGTYYIGVTNVVGGQGAYNITVIGGTACPPPPPNDVCSSAVPIACGQTLTGTTVNATITGAPNSLCNGFLNNNSGGVWYVAENLCGSVTASICTSVPSWDSKIAVYSGSCGSLVCVTTDDDGCGTVAALSQATWTADANETYYIYVLGWGAADEGAFDLALTCTNTPVAATATATDDCANNQFSVAVNITDLGGAASATVNFSVNGVAQPPVTGAGLGVTPLGPFPTTAEVSVTVSNGASGCTTNLGSYFSNCPVTIACASPGLVVNYCYRNNDTKTWTFLNDTPGETITVTFVSGAMAPGDVLRFFNGTDNTGTLIAGSNYPDLTGVTVTTAIGVSAMFIEVESIGTGSCADGDPLASPWQFEVECTAGCLDPNGAVTPNVNCATYSFTLDVEVFGTGDAPTTDLVYTVNGGSPTTIPGLDPSSGIQNIGPFTIGSTVNVVLQHESDDACDKNLGNFQPGLSCPPPGTSCALPFVVNSYPFTQSNTTCGKGNNVIGTQCGLGTNYGGGEDFVYQLNIPSTGDYQISLQLTGGASFAGWFLKSSANCSNAGQCIANAVTPTVNGTASSFVNLAAGTYFLIVDSRPLPTCVAYNLSITPIVFLPGDNCNTAIPLTVGTTCTPTAGSVAGMTQSIPGGTCGGTANEDVWYSFVATATAHDVILDADFDAVLEVRTGACNGVNLACADNNFSVGVEQISLTGLSIGTTYLVRLWGWSAAVETNPGFDICVTQAAPPYDPCASIPTISACDVPTGPVVSAPGNGAFNNYGGPFGVPGQEKIFSFTATITGVHLINVTQLTGSWIDFFWKPVGTCDATGWNYVDDVIGTGIVAPSGTPLNFVAGTTYYIMWDPEDTGGRTVNFTVLCPIPPPANDLCANAIPVACNSSVSGTSFGSTNTGNPGICTTDLSTAGGVWYTVQGWNGQMTATTCSATGFDTKLGIFTGSCGAFTCVAGNDDDATCSFSGLRSSVNWTATSGTTYYIYVTGFGTSTGAFELRVTCGDNNAACPANGLVLDVETDSNFGQTSWELVAQGTNVVALSGGNFPGQGIFNSNACLPDGCYYLRVLDSGGDGIANGGYILRTSGANGQRVIDNRDNFTTGSVSAVIGNGGFCLPLGTDRLIFTSCDKLDWVNNQFVVAAENPAVSAQFGVNNANSGYQFWWFDPNGSYGYTKFRNHATSDGFGSGATRACHARINNWTPATNIPANVLMNVKVRGRVNGSNLPWGPVCRFMIDPVRAACPFTKLMDIPGNQFFSCGVTRAWGSGAANRLVAKAVDGATQYQFRFVNSEVPAGVVRTTTTPVLQLNWTPALANGTYEVQVRAFKNGAWCVTSLPWGDVCNVTITGSPASQSMALPGSGSTADAELVMFPNPNNGDQLTLSLSAVEQGVETVNVDIFDLSGARVVAKVIPVNDGMIFQQMAVNELASGLYMVTITAGSNRYTERLVISK